MDDFNNITNRIAALQEKAKERPEVLKHNAQSIVQLPVWPELTRGVPNGVLRSALFGAVKKGERRYMERERIASLDGIDIHYTGKRLDQGDLSVWETVLHINRAQALGERCHFTAYRMLKTLGKTDTGGNRDVLYKRLLRLKINGVEVRQGRFSYTGSLINEIFKDEKKRNYVIVLNPKLRSLFASDQFTQIDWSVRHALNGKPLAQWLHGYYASHAKPYPINVVTLLKLSGSENTDLSSGRQMLRKALDALTDASMAAGQSFSYDIRGDLVHVEKKPTATQRRYLNKKAFHSPKRKL